MPKGHYNRNKKAINKVRITPYVNKITSDNIIVLQETFKDKLGYIPSQGEVIDVAIENLLNNDVSKI